MLVIEAEWFPFDAAKIAAHCVSVNVHSERACPQFANPPESGMKTSPLVYCWVSESGSCKYTLRTNTAFLNRGTQHPGLMSESIRGACTAFCIFA